MSRSFSLPKPPAKFDPTWGDRFKNATELALQQASIPDPGTITPAMLSVSVQRVLYQNGGLTTTSTSDVSVASYSLPGSTLVANFQALRIRVLGNQTTQAGTLKIVFGATNLVNVATTANKPLDFEALVTRLGATSQVAIAKVFNDAGFSALTRTTPAETLSGAVTIDFRGSVTAGGTLAYDAISIEYLAA